MKGVIIFLILLIGGGIFLGLYLRDKNLAAKTEAYHLGQARNDAQALLMQFAKPGEKVAALCEQGDTLAAESRSIADAVTRQLLPPPVAAQPAAVPRRDPAVPAKPTPAPDEDAGKLPGGLLTREQLEARRNKAQAPAAAPAETPAEDARPASPPPAPRPTPRSAAELPIQKLLKDLEKKHGALQDVGSGMAELADRAASLQYEAAQAPVSTVAAAAAAKLRDLLAEANGRVAQAEEALGELRKAAGAVRAEQERVEKERQAAEAAESRRKAEAEHQAKVAKERAAVEAANTKCMALLKAHKFSEAVRELEVIENETVTDEARADVKVVRARVDRVSGLRTFLVERLNTDKFAWGWRQGVPQARDITGATEAEIQYTGGVCTWEQVGVPQMMLMLGNYIKVERLKLSERGELFLSWALYCQIQGDLEKARAHADSAAAAVPRMAEERSRLMPGL